MEKRKYYVIGSACAFAFIFMDYFLLENLINTSIYRGGLSRRVKVTKLFQQLKISEVDDVSSFLFKMLAHIVFGTLNREKILHTEARVELSKYFYEYSKEKNIYMKINYVNSDHPHLLIDLPTNLSIEAVVQLYKGSSSNWINKSNLLKTKFNWGRGYGVFSVSESSINKVCEYIVNQEDHHKVRSFTDEYKEFITSYGMKYIDEV